MHVAGDPGDPRAVRRSRLKPRWWQWRKRRKLRRYGLLNARPKMLEQATVMMTDEIRPQLLLMMYGPRDAMYHPLLAESILEPPRISWRLEDHR